MTKSFFIIIILLEVRDDLETFFYNSSFVSTTFRTQLSLFMLKLFFLPLERGSEMKH